MKIRKGFVSNSSSSSFVLYATKENYDKMMQELNAFERDVAEHMKTSEEKFMGIDVVSFSDFSDMGGNCSLDNFESDNYQESEDDDSFWEARYEAWEKIQKMLSKEGQHLSCSQDW